jgi:hypothetical protein
VSEIVGDDGMHVGQLQGVVGADHVFRSHAVFILLDNNVQTDTALADADGASIVHAQRRQFGAKGKFDRY